MVPPKPRRPRARVPVGLLVTPSRLHLQLSRFSTQLSQKFPESGIHVGQELKNPLDDRSVTILKNVTLLSEQIFEFLDYFREFWLKWNHYSTPKITKIICYACWIFDIYDDSGSASGHLTHSNVASVQYKQCQTRF